MGSIDAECDFGSISAGLKPGSKILRPSDRNDRITPLFKSLRVRIQKKTPKMEFFLDRLKMASLHPVIQSFTKLFWPPEGKSDFPQKKMDRLALADLVDRERGNSDGSD